MSKIIIKKLNRSNAKQLAVLLQNDEVLRKDLGFQSDDYPSAKGILSDIAKWCETHRATTYAILAGDTAIGTISLSNRSIDGFSATIGYWIGSKYRRYGYCSQAFTILLDKAFEEGIENLSTTIKCDNISSRKIWEKRGATAFELAPGKLQYKLKLNAPTRH